MADESTVIAHVTGTMLVPGVSKNKRLYTAQHIAGAVAEAKARIASPEGMPITSLTHHLAGDDSEKIVGQITKVDLDEATGKARYGMDIVDTPVGRSMLQLIKPSRPGGKRMLQGVSIRGAWVGGTHKVNHNGETVETGAALTIDGLDFTKTPGVPGAGIDTVDVIGAPGTQESADGRVLILESFEDAEVTLITEDGAMEDAEEDAEEGAPTFQNGRCTTCKECKESGGPAPYADPGYQDDDKPRYPVGDQKHAKAAWSYVHQKGNAAKYNPNQLKRVKGRIKSALKKHGVKVTAEGWLATAAFQVAEGGSPATGGVPFVKEDPYVVPPLGAFTVVLNNRIVTVCVSSHLIDPADLEVVGAAAMRAANAAIKVMDPDEDGDIDVPGAGDDKDDAPLAVMMPGGYESASIGTLVATAEALIDQAQVRIADQAPSTPAVESAPGDPISDSKESGQMAEPTDNAAAPAAAAQETAPVAAATESAPVEPAAPVAAPAGVVTFTQEQFASLLGAIGKVAEAAPVAAPAVEAAAPVAPVVAEAAPVVESEEARVERLVQEKLTAALQAHAQNGGVQRKGLVGTTESAPNGAVTEFADYGDGWPQKPLHKYTREEWDQFVAPSVEATFMGNKSVSRQG